MKLLIIVYILSFNAFAAEEKTREMDMFCAVKKDNDTLISMEFFIEKSSFSHGPSGSGERKFYKKVGNRELAFIFDNNGGLTVDYKDSFKSFSAKPNFLKTLFVGIRGDFDNSDGLKYICSSRAQVEMNKKDWPGVNDSSRSIVKPIFNNSIDAKVDSTVTK